MSSLDFSEILSCAARTCMLCRNDIDEAASFVIMPLLCNDTGFRLSSVESSRMILFFEQFVISDGSRGVVTIINRCIISKIQKLPCFEKAQGQSRQQRAQLIGYASE